MTKYLTIDEPKQTGKKTVFTHYVDAELNIQTDLDTAPEDYDTVIWLGRDVDYGDVFKAFRASDDFFTIYFGTKGDEFNLK